MLSDKFNNLVQVTGRVDDARRQERKVEVKRQHLPLPRVRYYRNAPLLRFADITRGYRGMISFPLYPSLSFTLSPSSLSECTRLRRCIGIVVARHSGYCSGRSEAIKRRRIMRTRLSFDPLSMTESLTSRGDRRVSNGRTRRLYVTGHRLHPIHLSSSSISIFSSYSPIL